MSGVEEQSPPDCPFCAVRSEFLYTIDRFTDPFPIYRCPRCKLQMRATDASPHRFYTEEYYTGKAEYAYVDERSQRRFFEAVWDARLKTIKKHVPPPADFLDVGCAFGGFALCAGKHGYRPRGLDISPYAVKEANQGGLDARVGELCDLYTSKERYDVVTLIEVIEHIADPIRAFETLSRIVRPGGLLVLQTANFDGLQAKRAGSKYHYYLPGHLYYYSKSNLRTILKRYGFETQLFFHGTDFGLLPKLRKMAGGFTKWSDRFRWIRASYYHAASRIACRDFAVTSSMVVYAFRDTTRSSDSAAK